MYVMVAVCLFLVSKPEQLEGGSGKQGGVEVYTTEFYEPSVAKRAFCWTRHSYKCSNLSCLVFTAFYSEAKRTDSSRAINISNKHTSGC